MSLVRGLSPAAARHSHSLPQKSFLIMCASHHHACMPVVQFTLVAEVVPLELRLSVAELTMAFPEDSVEPSVSDTITMENPGAL